MLPAEVEKQFIYLFDILPLSLHLLPSPHLSLSSFDYHVRFAACDRSIATLFSVENTPILRFQTLAPTILTTVIDRPPLNESINFFILLQIDFFFQ